MTIKIATWNVNSLRVRLPHIVTWIKANQPDVLALQETKLTDDRFPHAEFEEIGYQVTYTGQKTYNGMAILSKKPLTNIAREIPGLHSDEKRMLGGTLGNIRIWDIYVPNGQSVNSEKYHYKLSWLASLQHFLEEELQTHPKLIVLGDFNIAPEARDVYDPAAWEGQVLCSEKERVALQALFKLGLHDCFRLHDQPPDNSYSWWDYRLNAFKRKMGLRIDHILASPSLAKMCVACFIDKTPRGWERPSDHAPVVAEFKEI